MKKYIIGMLMVLTGVMPGYSQVKEYLKVMPESVLPLLSRNNVLDCLDFIENGQKAEVTNRMAGKSELSFLGNTMATFNLTSVTKADIKLFPKGSDDVLIYVVTTSATDSLADSGIKVYNSDWSVAPEEYQFIMNNPSNFNEIIMHDDSDTVYLYERYPKARFEGDLSEDGVKVVGETRLIWDKNACKFLIEQNNY